MSKPLLGGGAAAVALLSVSLLFVSQTSVASTLAGASEGLQQKGIAAEPKAPGADVTPTSDPNAEAAATSKDAAKPNELAESAKPVTATTVTAKPEPEAAEYEAAPAQVFTATAYSLRGRTASGRLVTRGLIAADRRVLPLGTRVRIEAGSYTGEYLVADTGGAVRGRKIDIWVPNTGEAMRFGRRPIKLTVLTRTRPRSSAQRTSR
ncbi:MAG TPA: 3D domain-containing protein [Pyrinomonadaceae bacterium]|jgi:3D (Asp-Asp-Asp) domain-containing protein|nr:3D domain-containing protein [Pyrinomonadaceae bacterium]